MDRDNDPSQTGRCKVKWNIGGIHQNELSLEDLPWSHSLVPGHNPSRNHTGGTHTGHQNGTKVLGISAGGDGQEFFIIGSLPKGGDSTPDAGNPTYKSDLPYPALSQTNGGQEQAGQYGDINSVVTQQSIVPYAETEGGRFKKAKFAKIDEPVGTWEKEIKS